MVNVAIETTARLAGLSSALSSEPHVTTNAIREDLERAFKTPMVPVVSILGILVCGAMIYGLGWTNWLRLAVWLVVGLVIYFGYSRSHSRLEQGRAASS